METLIDREVMSGVLDWVLNEPKYTDSALCVEIPWMSDTWDWVFVERTAKGGLGRTEEELENSM